MFEEFKIYKMAVKTMQQIKKDNIKIQKILKKIAEEFNANEVDLTLYNKKNKIVRVFKHKEK